MLKKFCALLAIILSAGFFGIPVTSALEAGDIVMSLNPSERDLELEAGESYESSVGVTNIGRLPFDVEASVSPYYVSGDDYEPDFESQSSYAKLYNWITLEKDTYHLEPGEHVDVKFTVKVPEGVVGGGQYAAIMLLSDSGIEEEAAVKVQGRLAAIIYGHISGEEMVQSGELVSHSLPGFMFNSALSATQTVKNTGNVDFRVKQTMTVTDFFSNREVVTTDSVSSDGQMIGYNVASVLPGTSRTGILTWTDAPKLGLFSVKQTISFLNQEYEFSQLVFLCPMWLLVVVIALIITLIIWTIFRIKNRRQNQSSDY